MIHIDVKAIDFDAHAHTPIKTTVKLLTDRKKIYYCLTLLAHRMKSNKTLIIYCAVNTLFVYLPLYAWNFESMMLHSNIKYNISHES